MDSRVVIVDRQNWYQAFLLEKASTARRIWCASICLRRLLPATILLVAINALPAAASAPHTSQAGVDFGPYLADVNRRVRRTWSPPKGKEAAKVVVLFQVGLTGKVSNVRLGHGSGFPDANVAALNAVQVCSFRPLPEGAHAPVSFRVTFDRNTASGGRSAELVSPDQAQETVQIHDLKTAIAQMRGRTMTFGPCVRSDGRPNPELLKRNEIARVIRAGGSESVRALAQELDSSDLSMRKNASFELLELGGGLGVPFDHGPKVDIKAAIPALIKALNDSDDEVRVWSMAALRSLGPAAKAAIPALRQAAKDKDQGIRTNARAALVQIEAK